MTQRSRDYCAWSLDRDETAVRCTQCGSPFVPTPEDGRASLRTLRALVATALDWCELAFDEMTGFCEADEPGTDDARRTVLAPSDYAALLDGPWAMVGGARPLLRLALDSIPQEAPLGGQTVEQDEDA